MVLALGGLVFGASLSPARATACDCAVTQWKLVLKEVSSSDPNVDHSATWPKAMFTLPLTAYITLSNDGYADGIIDRVEAFE